jgi:hypothetical protein
MTIAKEIDNMKEEGTPLTEDKEDPRVLLCGAVAHTVIGTCERVYDNDPISRKIFEESWLCTPLLLTAIIKKIENVVFGIANLFIYDQEKNINHFLAC